MATEPLSLVMAITGASGAVYAVRLLELLATSGRIVHLTISESGRAVIKQELGIELGLNADDVPKLLTVGREWPRTRDVSPNFFRTHHWQDFMAPIASGSYLTGGMVVCPCSGSTVSGIAYGTSSNLIQRAADVHLKERRKLVLVPRETPLSAIQLENLRRCAEAGAVVLPASPGWYHGVRSLDDLVDFVVARILDQLGIAHQLMKRWGDTK